jgi:deoxyribodipyrimidine photo-lyase
VTLLPTPGEDVAEDPDAAVAWVRTHLGHLALEGPDGVHASPAFRGGQEAADAALAVLDVTGYAGRRNEVLPVGRRGASRMSPYVRHGLVDLPTLWARVSHAPPRDRSKYRDELLWQEYARHVYARTGAELARPLRHEPPTPGPGQAAPWQGGPWPEQMLCVRTVTDELRGDGWLVNQTRMWLASQWTVRAGWDWREGEDEFFRHLLDGSRAANRLGWQWTVGTGTGKPYGFSRWQVRKRAPGLCERCPLQRACPIEAWPDEQGGPRVDAEPAGLRSGAPPALAGPVAVEGTGQPEAVWLTFESLGDEDPALAAHPDLPVVVVFDEPLLARLRLSGKRLVFLAETVASLATRRDVEVHLAAVGDALAGRAVAVTHAPVPGFARRARQIRPVRVHPWPWLVRPGSGPAQSFSAWRRGARA